MGGDAYVPEGKTSKLTSLIVSHVWNEAGIFVRPWVNTSDAFTAFLNLAFPGNELSGIRENIEGRYPATGPPFLGDQQSRLRKVLQDSTFVCNTRQLYDAYKGKTYVMQYNMPPGTHGSDLLASTWHDGVDIADLINSFVKNFPSELVDIMRSIIVPFALKYQKYFAAYAANGDPNALNGYNSEFWEIAKDDGNTIQNALKADLLYVNRGFFSKGSDLESASTNCEFWTSVAKKIGEINEVAEKPDDKSDGSDVLFGLQVQRSRGGISDTPEL